DRLDVTGHPVAPPVVIRVPVGVERPSVVPGGSIRLGLACGDVEMVDGDGPQVPQASRTPPEVGPDVIRVPVGQGRLAHPAERGHNVRAQDARLGNVLPSAIPRVHDARAAHPLDPPAQGLIPAGSPGHHVIPEGRKERVIGGTLERHLIRPGAQALARPHLEHVPFSARMVHDRPVLRLLLVIVIDGYMQVRLQAAGLMNRVKQPGHILGPTATGDDYQEVAGHQVLVPPHSRAVRPSPRPAGTPHGAWGYPSRTRRSPAARRASDSTWYSRNSTGTWFASRRTTSRILTGPAGPCFSLSWHCLQRFTSGAAPLAAGCPTRTPRRNAAPW